MPHIIAEPCVGVVEMLCVDVCPTDAIIGPADVDEMREIRENGGPDALKEKFGADVQMYIDPESKDGFDTPNFLRGACPVCGGVVEHEGGCFVCRACGYSDCA